MKAVIIYASTFHGNTYKLVEAVAQKFSVDIIDATKVKQEVLSAYDIIGFASGIDFGSFYKSVLEFAQSNLPESKKVFFMYTCGMPSKKFTDSIAQIAKSKNCTVCGAYGCKGFDTYGPWKIIGGMNKKHPNQKEILGAVNFFEEISK